MTDQLFDYVGEIYEAACKPEHWEYALAEFCRIAGAKSAGIFIRDKKLGKTVILSSHGIPKLVRHAYNLGLGKYDIVFDLMSRHEPGKCISVINDGLANTKYTSYFKMLMKPSGFAYVAGMTIFEDDDWIVGLGIQRDPKRGVFNALEMDQISRLYPHFHRAIKIQKEFHRLKIGYKSLESALTSITLGIILAETTGKVRYINPAAMKVLSEHKALTVSPLLRASSEAENIEFQRCLREVGNSSCLPEPVVRALSLTHPSNESFLIITMVKKDISNNIFDDSNRAIVIYLSGQGIQESITVEMLVDTFKLTRAESKVAIGLTNGLSAQEYARKSGVKISTVRSQLKKIFDKTSTSNQADLIRLVLSGPFNIAS